MMLSCACRRGHDGGDGGGVGVGGGRGDKDSMNNEQRGGKNRGIRPKRGK